MKKKMKNKYKYRIVEGLKGESLLEVFSLKTGKVDSIWFNQIDAINRAFELNYNELSLPIKMAVDLMFDVMGFYPHKAEKK